MNYLTQPFGLGDLAYWVFRPFVYITDWIWDTDMKDCSKCKVRRSTWNIYLSIPRWLALVFLLTLTALGVLWKIT